MARLIKIITITFFLISPFTSIAKGWIGIYYREILSDNMNIQIIDGLVPRSPAEKAGIMVNDTIISIDNHRVPRDFSLIQVMDTITYSREINFTIKRGNEVKNLVVNVFAPQLIPVLVKSISFWNHALFGYNIYINDIKAGNVRWTEDQELMVLPAYEGDNEIKMYVSDENGEIYRTEKLGARGTIAKFFPKKGYRTIISYDDESNKISISYDPLPDTEAQMLLDNLNRQESKYYYQLNSENMLAPTWFKKSILKSLDGVVEPAFRIGIFNHLIQCPAVNRLLILLSVFIVSFTFIAKLDDRYGTFFGLLLLTVCLFLGSFIVAWILNLFTYAVSGTNKTIPYEFICFILLLFFAISLLFKSTKSYFKVVMSKDKAIAKTLGVIAFIISWVGFISTIFYIIKITGKVFGFSLPEYL